MKSIFLPIVSVVLVVAFLVVASDAQYATKIYRHANGDQMTVDTGGKISCATNTLSVMGRTLAIAHSSGTVSATAGINIPVSGVDADDWCVASINNTATTYILSCVPYGDYVIVNLAHTLSGATITATVMTWQD